MQHRTPEGIQIYAYSRSLMDRSLVPRSMRQSPIVGRVQATVVVAGIAALVLLTPLRRLMCAPGMPFWTLFAVWALIVVSALWASTRRHER